MRRPAQGDVRMRGFVERIHLDQAYAELRPRIRPVGDELVALPDALGRTLAADVVSSIDVPSFAKSAVDGYGLEAKQTFGADDASAIAFELIAEVLPGTATAHAVGKGQAVRIMTGGAVPEGVDAVVMAEHTDERDGRVNVRQAVPPGKNVVPIGEDVRSGDLVLHRGRVLRPHDLGVLASLGIARPRVRRRPRVAVATTGNELISPEELASAPPTSVVNSNRFVVEALVHELGGEPTALDIVPDDREAVERLVREFEGDVLITTGGTSVGKEDYLPVVVSDLGELVVHGLNIRPGGPTGFGLVGGRLVFLLPGNPVAAIIGFEVLVRPALAWMMGREPAARATMRGKLRRKITSALNRVDFVRVRIDEGEVEPVRAGGAGVLTSMTRADGFVRVGKNLEGIDAGAEVEVERF